MNNSIQPFAIPSRAVRRGPLSGTATKPAWERRARAVAIGSAMAVMLAAAAGSAQAQQTPPPGDSAMVRLIRGLMASGTLAKDVGEALLAQAQAEALATQQVQRQAAAAAGAATAATASGTLRPEPGDVRVPYISATVRDQIRDEVKNEVMAQAKSEGWAAPNETPEWTKRIHIEGDMRAREESHYFSGGNSNIEIDFPSFNSGSGYDVNPNTNLALPPLRNTIQDRQNQASVRARLGIYADLSENAQAGIRLASGNDNGPVSTTQALGNDLGKKNVWLDQAWLSYKPTDWLKITGGRFGNPFWSTDTLFSNDLNFDGVAANFSKALSVAGNDVTVFGTLGYIPLEYSSDSFPSQEQDKASSQNKYMLGAQAGVDWKLDSTNNLRGALAYYDFHNISGQVSDPCALYAGATTCDTDWSKPAFMQKGNTLMLLRNISLDPLDPANTPQPQFVGLAAQFRLFDLNLRWDTKVAGYGLRLDGDFIHNSAYNADKMWARASAGIVNNFGQGGTTTRADFQSGANAYMLQATLGDPAPVARGAWNVLLGYKRIDPDALPDAFNDPTFHLGGTNARGYYLGASYAIDKNLWFTGRWSSSKEVVGAPLSIDVLQLELNARF